MQQFTIRTAEPDDVDALRDVYRRASLSNDGDRADLLANPDALEFADTSVLEGRTRAAVAGERVVGFATVRVHGDAAELDDLFVDPQRMRQGVARMLIADAVLIAGSLGAPRLDVTANGHALDFYLAVGFVEDGVAETQFGTGLRMHLKVPA